MKRLVPMATVVWVMLPAAAAQARFSAPQEVAAAGAFHRGFVAAADASGRLTVATRAADDPPRLTNIPRLIERPPDGGWADLPLVGEFGRHPYVYKTAISAAGDGVLGVAWVILGRTNSIQVAVRGPGGTLSDPIEIAGTAANGVNHAAIAVDADGDVLVAYETGTGASHTHDQGQIAVAYRPAGRSSFIGPVVVDRVLSNPPVVALAQDGTGIVTWTRRQTLLAATIGAHGAVGAAKPIARRVSVQRPVAAAGPRGTASVAYRVNDTETHGGTITHTISVRVLGRPAGGTFGPARRVFRGSGFGYDLAFATDEQGRATLAWTDYTLHRARTGLGRVRMTAGRVGGRFGRARVIGRRDDSGVPVSVAARNGHVAVAWSAVIHGQRIVEAAAGPWDAALTPQLIPSKPPVGPVAVAIAGDGRVNALWRAGQLWVSDGP
jgi:hypothetical protein